MKPLKLLFVAIVLFIFKTDYAQEKTKDTIYTYKEGDYNGIGKWYMGREIAYIMGYQGINWLERPEREAEENVSKLIKNMAIKPTDNIADIGAGSGYHVFKMAPLAKSGSVYAVDIQKEMLMAIELENAKRQLNNIKTIAGTESSTNLPENSIDKILMVDVYHEFSFPVEMLQSMKKALDLFNRIPCRRR